MAIAFGLAALTGCSASSAASKTTSQIPVTAPQLVHGALPGVQIVAVSALPKTDQQAVAAWVAADSPADKTPTVKPGSYTPAIDGHMLSASREVGTSNGIATSQITLQFDPAGTKLLSDFTTAHTGQTLAVLVGGRVVMASDLAEPLTTGQMVIEGSRELIDSVAKGIVPAP